MRVILAISIEELRGIVREEVRRVCCCFLFVGLFRVFVGFGVGCFGVVRTYKLYWFKI